jgi:hypothetical protein
MGGIEPEIGQWLDGTIGERTASGWHVETASLPAGIRGELCLRPPDLERRRQENRLPVVGAQGRFWVFAIYPSQGVVLLSDRDRGRLPISDRMRPRYHRALTLMAELLNGSALDATPATLESLSEAKGMVTRCLKKDQPDWYTVYELFEKPTKEQLSTYERAFLKSKGDPLTLIDQLRGTDFADRVSAALRALHQNYEGLPSGKRLSRVRQPQPDAPAETSNDSYVFSQISRKKLERANMLHRSTLALLTSFLEMNGFIVEENRFVDAFTRLKTGPAIFEVKSLSSDNEVDQCRSAISQLYEYRYLHNLHDTSLWVVLSCKPETKWYISYLRDDRKIHVLWIEDGAIAGPGVTEILRTGREVTAPSASG